MGRISWSVCALGLVAASAATVWMAPLGSWPSELWGIEYHDYSDPDGWYLATGLGFEQLPVWPGHPGLPVVLLVQWVARAIYALSLPLSEADGFDAFVVTHVVSIAVAVRLAMTLTHLASIWAVHRFALSLLPSRSVATLAALAYATSWPLLLYLKRISVEPFMVIFALLAIMSFDRWNREAENGQRRRALVCAGATGLFAAMGILSKFTIVTPLACALAASFVLVWRGFVSGESIGLARRSEGLGIYLLGLSLCLAAGSLWVDWTQFFTYWFGYSDTEIEFAAGQSVSRNLLSGLPGFVSSVVTKLTVELVDGALGRPRQLHSKALELVYSIGALAGFVIAWRQAASRRARLVWIACIVVVMTPIPLFRNFVHYWFVHHAVAAPFFGLALLEGCGRVARSLGLGHRAFALAATSIALVHLPAIASWGAINAADGRAYARIDRCLAAIDDVRPGQKISVVGDAFGVSRLYGVIFVFVDHSAPLRRAFFERLEFFQKEQQLPSGSGQAAILLPTKDAPCRVVEGL